MTFDSESEDVSLAPSGPVCYVPNTIGLAIFHMEYFLFIMIDYTKYFNDCIYLHNSWPLLQTTAVMATMLLTGWPCYCYMAYNVFIIINYTNYYLITFASATPGPYSGHTVSGVTLDVF